MDGLSVDEPLVALDQTLQSFLRCSWSLRHDNPFDLSSATRQTGILLSPRDAARGQHFDRPNDHQR